MKLDITFTPSEIEQSNGGKKGIKKIIVNQMARYDPIGGKRIKNEVLNTLVSIVDNIYAPHNRVGFLHVEAYKLHTNNIIISSYLGALLEQQDQSLEIRKNFVD